MKQLPRWPVFANVALNTLFDFEALRLTLSDADRLFFIHSSVDCAVFDERGLPRYCFELDSSHHDTDEQARRDSYKDRIFAAPVSASTGCVGLPLRSGKRSS